MKPSTPHFLARAFAPAVVGVTVLAIWVVFTAHGIKGGTSPLIDPLILPAPVAVWNALITLSTTGGLWNDVLHTLGRSLAALLLAMGIGVPLGLLLGYKVRVYRAVEGIIHALRSVPAAALFPLFLIVIGVGEWSIVALATYNSLMVILLNTVTGTMLANESRIYHARLLGLSGWGIATQVLYWEALPHILGGIRIALGYGLALVIAVEMFIGVSEAGLGRKIFEYQSAYRIPETYAAILLTSFVGIFLNWSLTRVERYALRWHPDNRAEL